MNKIKDLFGQRFGKLVVLGFSHKTSKHSYWKCVCDCGKISIIRAGSLTGGHTKSCGCGDSQRRRELAFRLKESNKKDPNRVAEREIYLDYRKAAGYRNIPFDITLTDITETIYLPCYYCKSPPSNIKYVIRSDGDIPVLYNGIDRKDNTQGYIKHNIVPCCKFCNQAKMNRTLLEFRQWIYKIHRNINNI